MSKRVGSINIGIGVNTKQFTRAMDKMSKRMDRFGGKVRQIGTQMTAFITAPIAGLGFAAVKAAGDLQTLQTSFEVLTGSADKAKRVLEDIKGFSAKTPFRFEEIANSSKAIVSLTGTTDGLVAQMTVLGNISSGTGASLKEVAQIYTKVLGKGKLQAEEINQFAERGIPITQMLAEEMGVAATQIRDLASDGKVTSDILIRAFSKAALGGGQFAGAMEKQSKTIPGLFSTLADNIKLTMGDLGEALVQEFNLNEVIQKVINFVKIVKDKFLNLSGETKLKIFKFAGAIAALGPILIAVGGIVGVISLAITGFAAVIGLAMTPVGLLLGGLAALGVGLTALDVDVTDSKGAWAGLIEIWNLALATRKKMQIDAIDRNSRAARALTNIDGTSLTESEAAQRLRENASIRAKLSKELQDLEQNVADAITNTSTDTVSKLKRKVEEHLGVVADTFANFNIDEILTKMDEHKLATGDASDTAEELRAELERLAASQGASSGATEKDLTKKKDWTAAIKAATSATERFNLLQAKSRHEMENTAHISEQVSDRVKSSWDSAIDGIVDGTADFGDIMRNMFNDIASDIIKNALSPLRNAVSDAFGAAFSGGGDSGGGGGFLGGLFGGFFADGGRPPMGKVSVVGERGPELFVPDTAGTIIPNHALGGGGVTIHQSINISTGVQDTVKSEIVSMLPDIAEASSQAVEAKVLQGGAYSKNIRGQ